MVNATLNITGTTVQKMPPASEQIDLGRKTAAEDPAKSQDNTDKKTLHPEELLKQIKALTENGAYSVNFETDSTTGKMVVKVVDTTSQKVIRQIPPEALLGIDQTLTEFSGNFVNKKA